MTMTPETLHHQLVKPQSKSKQRRILTAHNPFHQDLKGRNFYFLAAKLNHAKPPRTESKWSGPKLQSLLGRNPTFSVSTHQTILRPKDRIIWCGASFDLDHWSWDCWETCTLSKNGHNRHIHLYLEKAWTNHMNLRFESILHNAAPGQKNTSKLYKNYMDCNLIQISTSSPRSDGWFLSWKFHGVSHLQFQHLDIHTHI